MARPRSILYTVDEDSGCWLWQGVCSWNGYARVKRDNRLQWAHKWYYEQRNGPVLDGKQLDHLCRTPKCVNPDHLEIVTPAENQRRGKAVRLTWDAVNFIRQHQTEYSQRELGEMFGVTHSCIQKVIHYKSWTDEPVLVGGMI